MKGERNMTAWFWYAVGAACLFFVLFQKGGPLSAMPMILAGGAALMAISGILVFKEPATVLRLLGIALAHLSFIAFVQCGVTIGGDEQKNCRIEKADSAQ
jgi:multidrug transporter EmrE-like cation transporter